MFVSNHIIVEQFLLFCLDFQFASSHNFHGTFIQIAVLHVYMWTVANIIMAEIEWDVYINEAVQRRFIHKYNITVKAI